MTSSCSDEHWDGMGGLSDTMLSGRESRSRNVWASSAAFEHGEVGWCRDEDD